MNEIPSIVIPCAAEVNVQTPLTTASASLVPLTPSIPALGPLIVKLGTLIVTFSKYSPATSLIISPSLAAAKASANVA